MGRTARLSVAAAFGTLILLGLALVVGLGVLLVGGNAATTDTTTVPLAVDVTTPAHALPYLPAPRTAAGFAKMWDEQVPASQWGGGDGSFSVPMTARRSVWLYGDTLSGSNGFVHSTAITQDGGRLHVSHGGAQLLANEGLDPKDSRRQLFYWIEDGHRLSNNLLYVRADLISAAGAWDFHRANPKDHAAVLRVSAAGDVTFLRWAGWVTPPAITKSSWFEALGPGHIGYLRHSHPEYRLADGHVLVTECQNWTTTQYNRDGSINMRAYRPLFRG